MFGVAKRLGLQDHKETGTRPGGLKMRASNMIELVYLESEPSEASANVYDLGERQEEGSRLRRIGTLEYENALLMRKVSEIQIEIARLRKSLTEP